jgi:hypothetical protein
MGNKQQISIKLRERVFKIFEGRCYYCDKILDDYQFSNNHYHHFIPEMMGGRTDETNLVLCCYDCHTSMHKKVNISYNSLRKLMYNTFCSLLEIYPCHSWDDDLQSVKKEIITNPKEVPDNWLKLTYLMKWMDNQIGGIDNKLKVSDMIELSNLKDIFKLLNPNSSEQTNLTFYTFMSEEFNTFIKKSSNHDKNKENNQELTKEISINIEK